MTEMDVDLNTELKLSPKLVITCLVVDDVEETLILLTEVLSSEGYTVLSTQKGREALDILQREKVHLIVADAMMPKMDGIELCRQVRSFPAFSNIPFIMYTANYIDHEDQELARVVGVDKYVMKNDGVEKLLMTMNELVQNRYGVSPVENGNSLPILDDSVFYERHRTIVMKKLEDKMKELQLYTETLMKKNRELTQSESRYRRLFEHANIAIYVIDKVSKKIVDVNNHAVMQLGYSKEEILRLPTLPIALADGTIPNIYDSEQPYSGEATMRAASGKNISVFLTASPIPEPDDICQTLLFVGDLTEHKKMQEQLLQNEKMSMMGRIAAGIAHEIRNPLAGLSFNLHFLDRHLAQGTVDHESVQSAMEGVQRIQQVVEDTLGLARVAPPTFLYEAINPLIEKALMYLKLSLSDKSLQVHKSYNQSIPSVCIDPNQIQQVLLNVLQNAIDACPESGLIEITTDVTTLDLDDTIKYVIISIHDSGQGISQQLINDLFEPFHTTKSYGTGLGLMLSKYIIDRHHGRVIITNASNGGALVQIYLPIQQPIEKEIYGKG